MAEGGGDRRRRVVGHHPAARQEHDALGEDLHLAHVVAGDEEGGAVLAAHVEQAAADAQRDVGVERRRRLVEHQELGPVQDRLGDAHQRALARGQLVAEPVGEVRDPEALERFVRGGALVGHAVETGEHAERLAHPEPLGQRQVAGGEADVLHRLGTAAWQGVAAQRDGALVRGDGAEQHEQGGGLARPVRPEEPDPLPGRDGDADVVHGLNVAEALHEGAGIERGFHRGSVSPGRRPPCRGISGISWHDAV